MEVYMSEYQNIQYNEDKSLIKQVWSEKTQYMTDEEFQEEMQKLAENFDKYKPNYVFIDQRNFLYVVVPSMQRWVDMNVNKVLVLNKCKKIAFIVPPDFLAKLAVSQTLQESYSQNLNVRFFDKEDDGWEWLGI